ncbi:hypothetical protein AVEN_133327-1 [Araneus ventricosus]|uniref:Uncharacterized protein n=1 Tax=Araneus ventricosus TaxID=182803 RepID=A0A4Y2DJV3_ARAVE|nr:hypothetical protein AVEN_133327-1 [Araneus ventricosus]
MTFPEHQTQLYLSQIHIFSDTRNSLHPNTSSTTPKSAREWFKMENKVSSKNQEYSSRKETNLCHPPSNHSVAKSIWYLESSWTKDLPSDSHIDHIKNNYRAAKAPSLSYPQQDSK